MLLGSIRRNADMPSAIDTVHNYYENLVIDEILRSNERSLTDREFLADVACVALNRLPPRYIRHNVDMTFFMSTQELQEVHDKVTDSVKAAVVYVTEREAERLAQEQPVETPPTPESDDGDSETSAT